MEKMERRLRKRRARGDRECVPLLFFVGFEILEAGLFCGLYSRGGSAFQCPSGTRLGGLPPVTPCHVQPSIPSNLQIWSNPNTPTTRFNYSLENVGQTGSVLSSYYI